MGSSSAQATCGAIRQKSSSLKLVSRHRDERDKRNVLVKRTVEGALYIERFGDDIIAKALELPM